jgi:hypothetical protein
VRLAGIEPTTWLRRPEKLICMFKHRLASKATDMQKSYVAI